jgi:hypothetical protein
MGMMRLEYSLVGKPAWKRLLGRPRLRWENNIKMDLKEIVLECVDWIHLAQDRDQWWVLVNAIKDLRIP